LTFTLVSHLKEEITELIRSRSRRRKVEREEAERQVLRADALRTKGIPVTNASFETWKIGFLQEIEHLKEKEQDEKLRVLSSKEREEVKKVAMRLTGKQLFEKNRHLAESDSLLEEGVISVDFSQYHATAVDQENELPLITLDDSD